MPTAERLLHGSFRVARDFMNRDSSVILICVWNSIILFYQRILISSPNDKYEIGLPSHPRSERCQGAVQLLRNALFGQF